MSDTLGAPLLSICIPSYNRPQQLEYLLSTIDCDPSLVEIVICEDAALKREEVRLVVEEFAKSTKYKVIYKENETNLGYDGNIRRLIETASGIFVMFMGDDDWFKANSLDNYLVFLKENLDVGYVLRSYYGRHPDGRLEPFFYLPSSKRLIPSIETYVWLFKRSVVICGVTFKRQSALKYSTDNFDGTLLYQLYLVLEICSREESVYSDIPVAVEAQSFRTTKPQFGTSSAEKGRFTPGEITFDNSINFTKGFFIISQAFDKKYNVDSTSLIQRDLSKYSYPLLSIQRRKGLFKFITYSYRLAREAGINSTWHYYFYALSLSILGESVCDKTIQLIKNKLGYTPHL